MTCFSLISRSVLVLTTMPALAYAQENSEPLNTENGQNRQEKTPTTDENKPSLVIGDIVVTARRTEERLQDTPVAVSAFSANDLAVRGATDLTNLSGIAPSLSFESGATFSGTSSTPTIFIRGIGQADFVLTAEPAVGIYVDGVFVARSVGSLLELVDVDRVEVLRGPQGTLFGRNSIGGVVSLISKKPDDYLHGSLELSAGEFSLRSVRGSLNVPLGPNLGARFSGLYREQKGYVDAIQYDHFKLGGEKVFALTGTAAWEATDSISVRVSGDYSKDTSPPAAWYAAAAIPDFPVAPGAPFRDVFNRLVSGDPTCLTPAGLRTNPRCFGSASILTGSRFKNNSLWTDIRGNKIEPQQRLEVYGTSLTLERKASPFNIRSITGYRGFDGKFNNDADLSPHIIIHNLNNVYKQHQFSQEVQIFGKAFRSSVDWLTGLYYFNEKVREHILLLTSVANAQNFPAKPLFFSDDRNAHNKSAAWFAQSTLHVLDRRLHVTGGVRYTKDWKEYFTDNHANPTVTPIVRLSGKQKIKEWTPMANVAFDLNRDLMAYVNYSEGFRDGGFPPRIVGTPTSLPSYDPEFVSVWEVGFKSEMFNKRLRLNVAAFLTDYSDIQVPAIRTDVPAGSVSLAVDNLASATLKGLEIEANFLATKDLRLDFSAAYLENKIEEVVGGRLQSGAFFISEESELPYMPKWTTTLGVSYRVPFVQSGDLYFRGDWTHIGEQFYGTENIPEQSQKAYDKVNGSIRYIPRGRNIEITGGVRNLTDEIYSTAAVIGNDIAGSVNRNVNRPRQLYGSLKVKFGRN